MKKIMSKKIVKIIAMIMVVVMMASVCMMEAFAANSTVTKTFQGYTAKASVGTYTNNDVYGDVIYDVSAVLQMTVHARYIYSDSAGGMQENRNGSGGANHYTLTVRVSRPGAGWDVDYATGIATVSRNGGSIELNPQMY